jgi:signal transduction histidine kinase/ligand-binding sensor domain-containing protein/CheY-like chemotaxis protein
MPLNRNIFSFLILSILNALIPVVVAAEAGVDNSNTQFINTNHYDQYRGLLGEKVTQIDQDDDGYMWFATHHGLNRFDSQHFIHYKQDSLDANSLPSNKISLFTQSADDMWLSLNNVGLARFNKDEQRFSLIPEINLEDSNSDQGIFHSVVFALAADQQDHIWIFQFDAGISVYDPETQRYSHLTQDNTDWLQSVRFFDAKTASDGHIWAVTLEGLVYDIDPNTQQAEIHRIDVADATAKEARIYSISLTDDGDKYLAAYNGVYQFDDNQKRFIQIINRSHIEQLMGEPMSIRNITADNQGRLWLSTLQGLVLFSQGQLSEIKFLNQGTVINANINVRSVFEDREHNIWVATDDMGVFKLNHRWHQTTIKRPFSGTAPIDIGTVHYEQGNFDDNMWLYDKQQHQLAVYRYQQGQLTQLQTYREEQQLPKNISGIYVDSQFDLWVFSVNGLYRLNRASQKFELMDDKTGISFMMEMGNELYAGLYNNNHLFLWDTNQQQLIELTNHPQLNDILSDFKIDTDGHIWLTGNNGLEVIDAKTFNNIHSVPNPEGFTGITLQNDKVWLISNGKIIRYRLQDDALISESTSVLNQLISSFAVSQLNIINDQLWLNSQAGLFVIDPDNNRIINRYTNQDNLPGRLLQQTFKLNDNSVMVITNAGLVNIKEQTTDPEPISKPTLVLSRLRHNGDDLSKVDKLTHNYGNLQVDYQLLSFSQPDSHHYQYRLSSDQDWLDAGQQTSQNFYQLPAGDYLLQIRGRSMDHAWSAPLQLNFQVAKAPWATNAAYWLYGAAALLLLSFVLFLWRKRWQYNYELQHAHEKQAFVENQLSLTSSLVQSLDVDELFAKIKQQLGQHIQCSDIEICYWNTDNNDQIFSDDKLTVSEQNRLGSLALRMYETDQKHQLESDDRGHFLHVLFSHSKDRLGLITFYRKSEPFKDNIISLAIAYVAQSSLAIENARLFQAVQHLAEQAKTSSKAKSDFLAQVSHEIRTPMNGILGMNQLLLESPLNDDQRLYAQAVNESGEHLLDIINDILDLSKIEAGKLVLEEKPFNLVELIDEITQSFVPVSKNKRLSFVTCLDADLPAHWLGDATRIKQIMINLLSNAFKFTHKGNVLLSIQPTHDSDELLIVVRDTGMGIEQNMINNLFDPFAQADSSITRKYGGTGLGLSIVKQLCEKMSGDINIDSQTGRGTEVSCLIKANLNPSVTTTPQSRNTTACLMADDSAVKSALTECLLRLGMTVSYDIEEPFDYLFVIDHKQTAYNHAIEIAQREFKPVYLLKSQLQNNPHHQGSFKVLNWPFLHKQIADLFSLSQELESNDTTATSSGKTLHLLVLEDNVINQQLLLELLEKAGHVVDLFDDPHQALNAIDNTHYDALLVDYHLPGMTGIDFVLACRELGIRSTTVMMSADISNELKQRCQQHSIVNLLIKPFKIDVLMQILNQD